MYTGGVVVLETTGAGAVDTEVTGDTSALETRDSGAELTGAGGVYAGGAEAGTLVSTGEVSTGEVSTGDVSTGAVVYAGGAYEPVGAWTCPVEMSAYGSSTRASNEYAPSLI